MYDRHYDSDDYDSINIRKGTDMRKSDIVFTTFIACILLFSWNTVVLADELDATNSESTIQVKEGTEVYGEDISKLSPEELQYVPEAWRDGEFQSEHPEEPEDNGIRIQAVYPDVNKYIESRNLKPAKIEYDHKSVFPKFNYRYGSPEGVVAHETANNSSTITGEISYMTRNYRNAFVHAFVDGNRIIEIHPTNYGAWGGGRYANERFIHVELVRVHSFDDFASSINNYATYIADVLHKHELGVVSAEYYGKGTLWSHKAVSRFLGGTTHVDPHGYFSQWGYSWTDFVTLVGKKYEAMVQEESTSKLGHIRNRDVKIYESPSKLENYSTAGSEFTNQVYYIKKQYRKGSSHTYYLISTKPSATEGTVGWVKSTDMQVHTHTSVDKLAKRFIVKGTGKAYSRAWGGSKDLVYDNLSLYTGELFEVHLTEKVGNNTWYRGNLNGQRVWIHSGYLEEAFSFTDVPNISSHYDSIYTLVDMGVINGYPQANGTHKFKPEAKLSRQHAAVLFTRALDLPAPADLESTLANLSDISTSHDYAREIAATYEAGIFRGNNRRFMDGPLTREQMATVLVNAFHLQDTGVPVNVRLDNVSPTHQENVRILAQHGITVVLDDYRPAESVTRAQFATFMYRSMAKTGLLNVN